MGKSNEERMEEKRNQSLDTMIEYELGDEELSDSCYEDAVRELFVEYMLDKDEYLVDGAILCCDKATTAPILIKGQPIVLKETDKKKMKARLETTIWATDKASMINGMEAISVKDRVTKKYREEKEDINIEPFQCNCLCQVNDEEAEDILRNRSYFEEHGTCCRLIKLKNDWENMIRNTNYWTVKYRTEGGKTETAEGVTMLSMLFCSNGGIITPLNSGQTFYMQFFTEGGGALAGYLAYGGGDVAGTADQGFYKLYDGPTLAGKGRMYRFSDIYDTYWKKGDLDHVGAIQAYCAKGLNTINGTIRYEGQEEYTVQNGVLTYNGMQRYAIALGPALQNPDLELVSGKEIMAEDMIYGTCVDVGIEIKDKTYYIPAVIVDTKAHTAPDGMFQTGEHFGSDSVGCDQGNIVEWYMEQGEGDRNKSAGLNDYSLTGEIIIYDGQNNAAKIK